MTSMGLIIVWAVLIWSTRYYFQKFIESIRQKDRYRLEKLQNRLHKHFVFQESDKIRKHSRYAALFILILAFLFHSILIFICGIFFYLIFPFIWLIGIEKLRKQKFQKQLLLLLPSLSSLLKSGHGLERSLEQLKNTFYPPMSHEIDLMLKQMRLGSSLIESFQKLHQRFPSENLQMIVHAITLSKKLGTSLSHVMDNITQSILEKEKLKQQIMALTAQGKIQAWIAVVMPFGIAGMLQIIAPHYFLPLYKTTPGHICIGYCLVSMCIGLFWIHKISTKEYL
jgi:tight adherence protein B